ncbi:hypothetical protein [Jiangella gansuensis]|uniref:hypothetical protein n=1 Tax=Jiangella gansuensis TaxID=281473 RepID=UPI00047E812C|nr:hypothetical protein [Jiangella gansuensis]
MQGPAATRGRLCTADGTGFRPGSRRIPQRRTEVGTICAHDDSEGFPWCVEHDPTGTCLGDVRRLPGGGAAWLEGAGSATLRIALGRPRRGNLSQLTAAQVRELIATLEELSEQMTSSKQ